MKVDRLISIINILNNNKRVSAKELSERFQVSVKTIHRDIDSLSVIGIPIVSYKGFEGGYEILDGYKIEKSSLTIEQSNILINLLKGFYKGYAGEEVRSLIDKFGCEDKDQNQKLIIDFSSWGNSDILRKKIKIIDEAMRDSLVVEFEYINLQGIVSKRRIEPNKIILKEFNWYLYGFCRLKNEMRIFKIKRIRNLTKINEKFLYDEDKNGEIQLYKWDAKTVKLKLRFSLKSINRIDDYFDDYKIIEDINESRIIEIELPEDNYLYGMILSMGSDVEVLEPIELRKIIKEKIKNMLENY